MNTQAQDILAPHLNSLGDERAAELLMRCCGSRAWVAAVLAGKPFSNDAELFLRGSEIWQGLSREDWLEGFASHPMIGDVGSLKKKFARTADWAAGEQSAIASADDNTIQRLAQLNAAYKDKFGYIFIVCATGKSAKEMLTILESRLKNAPDEELGIAAAEHYKITELRLKKLLD